MEDLLKEAAILLFEVDMFGADDSVRRSKISKWLAKHTVSKIPVCDGCGAECVDGKVTTHFPFCQVEISNRGKDE